MRYNLTAQNKLECFQLTSLQSLIFVRKVEAYLVLHVVWLKTLA
jgi:hypothetical protein